MKTQIIKYLPIIFLPVFCLSLAQAETAYRSVDEKGVTEFSDKDKHGAEEMDLKKVPTYKFKKVKRAAPVVPQRAVEQAPVQIQIIKPVAKETIRDNQGNMTVEVKLADALKEGEKAVVDTNVEKDETEVKSDKEDSKSESQEPQRAEKLKEGEKLVIILNDEILLETDYATIELKNIDRGIHLIKVAIRDAEGKFVTESEAVEFYMKRMSRQFKKPVNPVKPKVAPPAP